MRVGRHFSDVLALFDGYVRFGQHRAAGGLEIDQNVSIHIGHGISHFERFRDAVDAARLINRHGECAECEDHM